MADDTQEGSLLEQMLEDAAAQAGMRSPSEKPGSDPLSSLLDSLPSRPAKSNKLTPERLAANIDAWITRQVSEIIARPEIQQLHLAWQRLKELVDCAECRCGVRRRPTRRWRRPQRQVGCRSVAIESGRSSRSLGGLP